MVVFACVGVVNLGLEAQLAKDSLSFTKVKGSVKELWLNSKRSAWHYATVYYTYKVDGKEFVNDREMYPNRMNASIGYMKGEQLNVYYDPKNPQDSSLSQGVNKQEMDIDLMMNGALAIAGLLVLAIGGALPEDFRLGYQPQET